jgi:preprotein translocase subunit SecF
MTERQDKILGFGIMLACTGATIAAMSFAMLIGFIIGVVATMGAATVTGSRDRQRGAKPPLRIH